jgi:hypothetical protein
MFREAVERDPQLLAAVNAASRWFYIDGQGHIRFYIRPGKRLPFHVELPPVVSHRE